MTPPITRRSIRAGLATAATLAAVALASGPASAATLNITYDASGSTDVATTGSTIPLGPTTLDTSLESTTGAFTGTMELPAAHTEFDAIGFIPMSADVTFEEVGQLSGSLTAHPGGGGSDVTATAEYNIRLSDIKIVGFPTFTGSQCRTKEPVTIAIANPSDQPFAVFSGGHLAGSYSIGDFANCGLNTWLVNALVPGGGNTVEFDLSNPRTT